jgi:hypothetical protein|nr:MAG TPA: hypothetical protein [Caudoviricetes sp.]
MKLGYMTTKQFIESVEAMGFKTEENNPYDVKYIDIKDDSGEIIAYVDVDVRGKMSVRRIAEGNDHNLLFKIMCAYANTPVCERVPKTYKLKILGTGLYLIHINEHEMTITTNKKAAKAYDDKGVYDAKVFAEKQGVVLTMEMVDVDD